MSADLRAFDLPGSAFPGNACLMNVVRVEFETSFQKFDANARELALAPGDRVIVETSRGPIIATVRSWSKRAVRSPKDVDQVLRRATEQDELQNVRNKDSELDAYRFAIERINARKLDMKLVRTQWMIDGSKIVFYFSADARVDFRDLVKDLAHRFRTRIEMHQIGVRDGTRMIGGIGPCGRELCCSTFLENFAPVSIRMAKDQGLTLNPTKVSGMCGRLMCCLVYEQQLYRSLKKRLPRAKTKVRTRMGPGTVIDVDVINKRVNVELEDGNRNYFAVADVIIKGKDDDDGYVDGLPGAQPEYRWDDEFEVAKKPTSSEPKTADDAEKPKKKKKKRRRRRRGKGKGGGQGKKI